MRLHDLRHAAATLMLSGGVDVRTVMEVMGHSQVSVTLNMYTHVLPHKLDDAAQRVDALLAPPTAISGQDGQPPISAEELTPELLELSKELVVSPEGIEPSTYRLRVPPGGVRRMPPLHFPSEMPGISVRWMPLSSAPIRRHGGQMVVNSRLTEDACSRPRVPAINQHACPVTFPAPDPFSALSAGLVTAPSIHRSTWPTVTTRRLVAERPAPRRELCGPLA